MKITIENYGKKISVETDHDDLGLDEYIDIFYSLLVSITFNESTIINGFKDFIESKEL